MTLFLLYHVLPGEVTSDAIPTDPPFADSLAELVDALLTALGADEIADVDDTVLSNTILYLSRPAAESRPGTPRRASRFCPR